MSKDNRVDVTHVKLRDDTVVTTWRANQTESRSTDWSILGVIFALLLCVCVLFTLLGKETIGLQWLLETLQNVPKIDMNWMSGIFNNNIPDWLDWIVKPVQALLFIGTAIVQALTFVIYVVGAVFF